MVWCRICGEEFSERGDWTDSGSGRYYCYLGEGARLPGLCPWNRDDDAVLGYGHMSSSEIPDWVKSLSGKEIRRSEERKERKCD